MTASQADTLSSHFLKPILESMAASFEGMEEDFLEIHTRQSFCVTSTTLFLVEIFYSFVSVHICSLPSHFKEEIFHEKETILHKGYGLMVTLHQPTFQETMLEPGPNLIELR